jgi:hypothetical protein
MPKNDHDVLGSRHDRKPSAFDELHASTSSHGSTQISTSLSLQAIQKKHFVTLILRTHTEASGEHTSTASVVGNQRY